MDTKKLDHLERLREDIRGEIKSRIEQRDKYSIQLTIALTALVAIAFSKSGFQRVLLATPLVSIYFTVLILYSYRVHSILARYLRDHLEPEIARESGVDVGLEWENFYAQNAVPGIRRSFFVTALWAVTLLSLTVLLFAESEDSSFRGTLLVAGIVYVTASLVITIYLGGRS